MPIRLIHCEACRDVLGELDDDGVFTSRHHKRRFVDPVVVECRCGRLWLNPSVEIDDERIKRLARVLTPRQPAVPSIGAA